MAEKQEAQTPEAASGESGAVAPRRTSTLWDLREEMEDLFDNFLSGGPFRPLRGKGMRRAGWPGESLLTRDGGWVPRLDLIDKDDEVKLIADLPGIDEKDINLEIKDDKLILSGEIRKEKEEGEKGSEYYLSERRTGSFRRSISIPPGIDNDKIEAQFKNGVLMVHLPKTPEAKVPSRKIQVKSAG